MSESNKDGWQRVAKSQALVENAPLQVRLGDTLIALYRVGDCVYATSDICTHEFALLTDGYQDGDKIECPLHQAIFHIPTGKACTAPAEDDLETFEVREIDGEVFVLIDERIESAS